MPNRKEPRSARSNQDRTIDTMPERKRILIWCEGSETEPTYFRAVIDHYRLATAFILIDIRGGRGNTLQLVQDAEAQQRQGAERFDEIWCVFDKDWFPDANFDAAINACIGHDFLRAAWSNEAFELWYILHFFYLENAPQRSYKGGPVSARGYYCERLDEILTGQGEPAYGKGGYPMFALFSEEMQINAVRNARKLLKLHGIDAPESATKAWHDCLPATTVHELFCSLLANMPNPPKICEEAKTNEAPTIEQLARWARMNVEDYLAFFSEATFTPSDEITN